MNNTRDHILSVAFNLFLQKSFKEVTLRNIVEETGLSKGAFYHYFNSKEQLFLELVNNVFNSVLDIPYDKFSKESLYHFYIDYINYYVENIKQKGKDEEEDASPSFNYISLIFDAIRLFPELKEKLTLSKQLQYNAWVEVISLARERGEIKSPMSNEQIANMFINSSGGIEIYSVYESNGDEIGRKLLDLWDDFYKTLKV
ncbi:TetR/AcrR family transcriptional regulator [Clostridium sp. AL.422]|uniref:TetR/AcrR family transcriptional regulator n=1 Tax=Clostridium TaxID=1485 RepID=UPI00293DB1C6|nr:MULTISPECIES: TetR/AcrR family transcriptional regulator [unclassified Clostridium]MDV4151303.1 TetR/AcrR family transcriptional regulator [Clostridium sp. AL.422]